MFVKKKSGAALVLVLILAAVLGILASTILMVTVSEVKIIASRDKNLKAYYIARAGADASLKAWLNANSANKPSGTSTVMYLQFDGTFSNTPASTNLGSFTVNITNTTIPASGDIPECTKATIVSTGELGDVTQKTTVTIDRSSNIKYGHDLGWYSYTSGQINYKETNHKTNGAVVVKAKNTEKLKFPNKTVDPVTYESDYLFLDSPVDDLLHNSLTLSAEIIVFNQKLDDVTSSQPDTMLILQLPAGKGFNVGGITYGKVFFLNDTGGYDAFYFVPGSNILTTSGRTTPNLVSIPEEDPYNIFPYYNYSITWSK